MKKLLGLVAVILVLAGQTGCEKSGPDPQLTEQKAYLNLANPAADGPVVDLLMLDSTHESVVPINKKEGWPQTQQNPTPVMVRIIDAGKTLTTANGGQVVHLREVYLVSFRVL
ncbi:MAG TPA: hypothetical protein VG605_05885 [Puia sp.]|nr:hypothetical protein [Puia sp.]